MEFFVFFFKVISVSSGPIYHKRHMHFYYFIYHFSHFLGVVLKSGHLVSDNRKTGQVLQVRQTTAPFKN